MTAHLFLSRFIDAFEFFRGSESVGFGKGVAKNTPIRRTGPCGTGRHTHPFRLHREAFPALLTATLQGRTAVTRTHPRTEAMLTGTLDTRWLIGPFHDSKFLGFRLKMTAEANSFRYPVKHFTRQKQGIFLKNRGFSQKHPPLTLFKVRRGADLGANRGLGYGPSICNFNLSTGIPRARSSLNHKAVTPSEHQ